MDPLTITGAGLVVLGSKELLVKLLGPTADYLGGEISGFVQKCNINLDSVFARATKKLGNRINQDGSVSPRILRHVLDDGRFCEDELAAEYYGGILAGSRDATGKDDQALPYLSKVREMSVLQIRLHFAFYYEILRLYSENRPNLGVAAECHQAGLLLPNQFLIPLFPPEKVAKSYWDMMTHSVVGLSSQGLITTYAYGPADTLKGNFPEATKDGAYMAPSFMGAELFLWALGIEAPNGHRFFDVNLNEVEQIIAIPGGAERKEKKASKT
jgi:hypothetical protein